MHGVTFGGVRSERSRNRAIILAFLLAVFSCLLVLLITPLGDALAAVPPTVTSISPSSGPTVGGSTVIVEGTGFTGISGPSAVLFGGMAAASYTVVSETRITAVTPEHAQGSVHVTVQAEGGVSSASTGDYFTFMTRYDQTDSRFAYSGAWAPFLRTTAWKGSYGRSSSGGASVTITFNGTRLDWIATKGTTTGIADVYLDGVLKKTVNLASATAVYQQRVWSTGTLNTGEHVVKIVRNSSSAPGKYLTIDAVDIAGSIAETVNRYEQNDARLVFVGAWSSRSASGASGAGYSEAKTAKDWLTLVFTGKRLDWIATKGPGMGKADVSVDGGSSVTVDLFSDSAQYQQKVWSTGTLTAGTHQIKISWNEGNVPDATITVDAFDVLGYLPAAASLNSSEIKWAERRLTDLSYCPGSVDGQFDSRTRGAVIAFEKWEGLARDGVINAAVWSSLQTATRPKPAKEDTSPWIEVNKAKQVLLFCRDGDVVWTFHVSTGDPALPKGYETPTGTWTVLRKNTSTADYGYYNMFFTPPVEYWPGGLGIHGAVSVPTYPASHGCVRTQFWDQDLLYPLVKVGTHVYVYD
jgi:peptidoglycan hydrolase-like protein with peptidoglycan-binding domain